VAGRVWRRRLAARIPGVFDGEPAASGASRRRQKHKLFRYGPLALPARAPPRRRAPGGLSPRGHEGRTRRSPRRGCENIGLEFWFVEESHACARKTLDHRHGPPTICRENREQLRHSATRRCIVDVLVDADLRVIGSAQAGRTRPTPRALSCLTHQGVGQVPSRHVRQGMRRVVCQRRRHHSGERADPSDRPALCSPPPRQRCRGAILVRVCTPAREARIWRRAVIIAPAIAARSPSCRSTPAA
jgi:hypothetical protein